MPNSINGLLLTALPLTDDRQAQISHSFQELLQKPVTLDMQVDQSLIGGIRVEILGRVYDGSVKAKLRQVLNTLQDEEDMPHA